MHPNGLFFVFLVTCILLFGIYGFIGPNDLSIKCTYKFH